MGRKKILLVDDSNTVILMEKMILAKGPYELVVAKDGQEGIEKAASEKPDLILMDVMMPRMTGFEACKKLRGQLSTASIPIILVTTRGEEESVKNGYDAGCNDYVTKPINGSELLSKVRGYLGA
jgi:DNA-binding response OmpR family regulator